MEDAPWLRGFWELEHVALQKESRQVRCSKMTKMSVAEMDVGLHKLLRAVQSRCSNLIADSVQIEDDYSMKRSLRQGATAEAQNARIPTNIIEANNRWRKVIRVKGMMPGMSMMEQYTDTKMNVPLLIRFSCCIGWPSLKSKRLEWCRIVGDSGYTSSMETQPQHYNMIFLS